MQNWQAIAKAIVGAVISALSALSAYLINDTGLGDVTAGQWIQVVIAFFVALGVIWAVPNKPTG